MQDRLHSHYASLDRAIGFIRSSDSKAAPVLALQAGIIGSLATRFEQLFSILKGTPWGAEQFFLVSALCLLALAVACATAFAARVYIPINPRGGGSLLYFEDVANMTWPLYRQKSVELTTAAIEEQLLDQVFQVSRVASTKMFRARWALLVSMPGVVLWVVLLAWSSI